jgi:hypothetical protein
LQAFGKPSAFDKAAGTHQFRTHFFTESSEKLYVFSESNSTAQSRHTAGLFIGGPANGGGLGVVLREDDIVRLPLKAGFIPKILCTTGDKIYRNGGGIFFSIPYSSLRISRAAINSSALAIIPISA